MKVSWSPRAKDSLRQIARYIQAEFGGNVRRRFMQEVRQKEALLRKSPNVGQIDPLFNARSHTYRSLVVNGLNKMVYYIKGDSVRIAAFWDTRQEPESQAEMAE